MINSNYLYHGSVACNLTELEPRRRYTPGHSGSAPTCVYATNDPAYAAAHAFPWSSDEGINLYYDRNECQTECVYLEVPAHLFDRLQQPICIYKLDVKGFTWVEEDVLGRTYRTCEKVQCLSCRHFSSVIEAVESLGGKVLKI